VDNLSYLFWAHVIFWAFLFFYIFCLIEKNKRLERELDALKNSINKSKDKSFSWQT
jgi:CcmD family protein